MHYRHLLLFLSIVVLSSSVLGFAEFDSCKTKYLFYLHGKIVEDQGPNATSEEYGAYEYNNILSVLKSKGFNVISEVRKQNTNPIIYAKKIVAEIDSLINLGVNPEDITVLGTSKGALIAIHVSNLMQNENINYVLIAIFSERIAEILRGNNVRLSGHILYIYDHKDSICGSGDPYISELTGNKFKNFKEIKLELGVGHGILYKPYDEWINPLVDWVNGKGE